MTKNAQHDERLKNEMDVLEWMAEKSFALGGSKGQQCVLLLLQHMNESELSILGEIPLSRANFHHFEDPSFLQMNL